MITANVGGVDAAIRAALSILFLFLFVALAGERPFLALGAALVALLLMGTALGRVCPFYALLGINTCRRPGKPGGT